MVFSDTMTEIFGVLRQTTTTTTMQLGTATPRSRCDLHVGSKLRCHCIYVVLHIDGLQHKGAMSTKPVFEEIAKIQRSYVPLCGRTAFVLLTPARTITTIVEITIFCNDVHKTSTAVDLLAVNILRYMS